MTTCRYCGMRGDADPVFHQERYGHWPVLGEDYEDTRDEVLYPAWTEADPS